jgi:vomeronasal 2 receptor
MLYLLKKSILFGALVWLTRKKTPLPNYDCGQKRKSPAALTGTLWATSAHIATLLKLYKIPQVRARCEN